MASGVAFFHPIPKPIISLTRAMPLASYRFFGTGTLTQALVYQDAFLLVPYSGQPQADEAGNFAPIYLDPRTIYRVQLVDLNGATQYDVDPYIPPMLGLGTGPIQVNPITGEVQINAPAPAALKATLTVSRAAGSNYAISCPGNPSIPNQPLLHFLGINQGGEPINVASVNNKPGNAATPNVAIWLPILINNGVTYYMPLWS